MGARDRGCASRARSSYARAVRLAALAVLVALAGCRRVTSETAALADASGVAPDTSASTTHDARGPRGPSAATSGSSVPHPGAVDDACTAHADCVAVELFVDGDLRCCVSCGATAAASKRWADRFGAFCAGARAMADCPIEECHAARLDARCVAGRCMLVPRP